MNIRPLFLLAPILLAVLLPPAAHAERVRTATPGPDAAKIVGVPGFPNRDIFSVRFVEINDQNILPRESLWLEPGSYRLTVTINAAFTRPPMRDVARDRTEGDNVIELELEAGKVYHVRGHYGRDDEDPTFSVILYKVEE